MASPAAERLVGGLESGDDLDEAHERRGVEEVHADDAGRVRGGRRDRRDRDR
jgi:hypothetical protein